MRFSANLYIDGFNLYYGLLKKNPSYKWLNPVSLVCRILTYIDIAQTEYFTADVLPSWEDPDKGNRQALYCRALKTIPNLEIVRGHYSQHEKRMALYYDYIAQKETRVWVLKREEKGSDVNLATHLLRDAFLNKFTTAIVLSNDSDLEEPIKICTRELGKYVYVLNPQAGPPAKDLKKVASKQIVIRYKHLSHCQFPVTLTDSSGTFTKPSTW